MQVSLRLGVLFSVAAVQAGTAAAPYKVKTDHLTVHSFDGTKLPAYVVYPETRKKEVCNNPFLGRTATPCCVFLLGSARTQKWVMGLRRGGSPP